MKSVHITNYYHKTSGGISTAYNHLLEAAARHRRYVRLIVPGETEDVEEVNEFAKIYYLRAKHSPVFDKRYRLIMPWEFLPNGTPLRKILIDEQPDMIEVADKYTVCMLGATIRTGFFVEIPRPMLVHLSCERMDDNVRSFIATGRIVNWFVKRHVANYVLPSFDFHLANSNYTAQEFCDAVSAEKDPRRSNWLFNFSWRKLRAPQVPLKDRIYINQCGVDNVTFNAGRRSAELRESFKTEFGITGAPRLLLYAGRISPEKNIGLLFETMEILSTENGGDGYKLLVAGAGPKYDDFVEQAKKEGNGNVIVVGHITDKEKLANLFANCDAFIHPNPREPFGITPLEAMASALPVVAPNSGGLLSYANDDNAWLADPTGSAFAAAVRSVFADDAERQRKVANAMDTASKYTWDASTDALFKMYDEMYAEFTANRQMYDYKPATKEDFVGELTEC